MKKPLTFIDLFCGCGGFSLGLTRAGFKDLPHVLEKELTAFSPVELEEHFDFGHRFVILAAA